MLKKCTPGFTRFHPNKSNPRNTDSRKKAKMENPMYDEAREAIGKALFDPMISNDESKELADKLKNDIDRMKESLK